MSAINDLNTNLINVIDTLNRLSNIISRNNVISDEEIENINDKLGILNNDINIKIDLWDIDDESDEDKEVEIPQLGGDYFYGIGETCLLLDPFDNYRVFNLFTDYTNKTPLNLSDGQKLYIVFRNGSKEVRVEEYGDDSGVRIDKSQGQVLFKINKKQTQDIMNLKNNIFYITRVYETYNATTDSFVTSDEEVLFSGYWVERTEGNETRYKQMIEDLQNLLNERTAAMQAMVDSINSLIEQNTKLAEEATESERKFDELKQQYDNLCDQIAEMGGKSLVNSLTGEEEATGEIIDSRTILVNYENADSETKKYLDTLTDTQQSKPTSDFDNLEDIL